MPLTIFAILTWVSWGKSFSLLVAQINDLLLTEKRFTIWYCSLNSLMENPPWVKKIMFEESKYTEGYRKDLYLNQMKSLTRSQARHMLRPEDKETFNCKEYIIPFKFKMSLKYHMKKKPHWLLSLHSLQLQVCIIIMTKIIQIGKRYIQPFNLEVQQ